MTDQAAISPVTTRAPKSHAWWNAVNAWLLLLPAAVLLVAFTHYPILATIKHSFFITKRTGAQVFVGIDNYQAMFQDPIFWKALVNNIWFALGTVPTSIALALVMALWVNRNMRRRGFLRLAFFTPTVLPMIAVANIWLFFYTPDYGLLDQLRGLFGLPGWNWLGDPRTVMGCLIVMVIWKEAGFFMIFYLAALQQLSPDLEEAAAVGGRRTLDHFPPHHLSAVDADHAVCRRQRGDQFLQAGRSPRHHDQGRSEQCKHTSALLHLRGRLHIPGLRLCGDVDRRVAGDPEHARAGKIRLSRSQDSLSMNRRTPPIELVAAGCWRCSG